MMVSDKENIIKMKGSKPPPPVPPRPSKSLIQEALAKTRQAHGTYYCTSGPKIQNKDKTPLQPSNISSSNSRQMIRRDSDSSRPVVYQSENCRSRKTSQESTKTEDSIVKISTEQLQLRRSSSVDINNQLVTKIECDSSKRQSVSSASSNNSGKSTICDLGKPKHNQTNQINIESVPDKSWDETLNNRNHVNTLIDEMFASVLEINLSNSTSSSSSTECVAKDSDNKITINNHVEMPPATKDDNLTIIVVNESDQNRNAIDSSKSGGDRKVTFNDLHNHEYLIDELQNMKNNEEKILKRQRMPSGNSDEDEDNAVYPEDQKIQTNDWFGVNEGKKVRMSSCHIKIDTNMRSQKEQNNFDQQKIKLPTRKYDLPPLPKSLSGFKFTLENNSEQMPPFDLPTEQPQIDDDPKEKTNLEKQLALLRREMNSLREQDLFLLSKLWFLNESIQDFRQILQEQEDKVNLTLSPSPTPSSIEDEDFYIISTSTC